jgi:hypothetical protein
MAKALRALGVKPGQTVATLAWNGYRHMELYYAVSGSGAVLHTLNPRLHPDQVSYIADHAEDQVLFFDMTFLPLIEAVAARLKTVKHFVAMTDRAHMPANSKIAGLLCYEELVETQDDRFGWPQFDENSASSGKHRHGASGGGHGGVHRRLPPQVGRAPAAGGGEEARCRADARADAAVLRRQDRQVVDAGRRGLYRRHPAGGHRQDAEEQIARAVQGPQAADGLR